jgi:MYXO-CTERM domain-containing protein
MPRLRLLLLASLMFTAVGSARADLAPPNACTTPGAACNTAGTSYNSAGVCVTSTCVRTLPPSTPGGPPNTSSSSCNLCELKKGDGGAQEGDSDGACSYTPAGGPAQGLGGLAVIALGFAVAFARRRR